MSMNIIFKLVFAIYALAKVMSDIRMHLHSNCNIPYKYKIK